jgi:hypothetical protein
LSFGSAFFLLFFTLSVAFFVTRHSSSLLATRYSPLATRRPRTIAIRRRHPPSPPFSGSTHFGNPVVPDHGSRCLHRFTTTAGIPRARRRRSVFGARFAWAMVIV